MIADTVGKMCRRRVIGWVGDAELADGVLACDSEAGGSEEGCVALDCVFPLRRSGKGRETTTEELVRRRGKPGVEEAFPALSP